MVEFYPIFVKIVIDFRSLNVKIELQISQRVPKIMKIGWQQTKLLQQ